MTAVTAAVREDAIAIFLAAVHVCEPTLVDAPSRTITCRPPFSSGASMWDWAATDPALTRIASAIGPDGAATVRAVLNGMLRERAPI